MLWFVAFLVVAALSCWATASSFMLIIPLPWFVIWAMTIVFFVFASFSFKMIMDALHNDGSVENPKLKLWGGIALLILTWGIISLPTNAHTFFYKLKIGDVITKDLGATEKYSTQLAQRVNISKYDTAEYKALQTYCSIEMGKFEQEANGTGITGKRFIDKYSMAYIHNINEELRKHWTGGKYPIPTPENTHNFPDTKREIDVAKDKLNQSLELLADDRKVEQKYASKAATDVNHIKIMHDSIKNLIMVGRLSHPSSEPIIKQAEGVLILAYANINMNEQFVYFTNKEDEKLYTAENLETRTSRFLHPYKTLGDFFTGKVSFNFVFWLILSILLDVLGFISFDLALKKDYDF